MKKIAILGGGQLGQMLALSAYPLGIRTNCLESEANCPAGLVSPVTVGSIADFEGLRDWVSRADVVTYEFENFPAELVAALSELRPVLPPVRALAVAQDRWYEKQLFVELDVPVPAFRQVNSIASLHDAVEQLAGPIIVKTRNGGYDGKGQVCVDEDTDLAEASELVQNGDVIAEQRIDFDYEVSIIAVRNAQDEIAYYPLVRNEHVNGILHTSTVFDDAPRAIVVQARNAVAAILRKLEYIGVLTLELFVKSDQIFANEIAPRVHNSGHWTIEGAHTSQFENHLRAISDLPLGATDALCPSAMVNLVGTLPRLDRLLAMPGTHLHLYGKTSRPGRKLGHVTITASTRERLYKTRDAVAELAR